MKVMLLVILMTPVMMIFAKWMLPAISSEYFEGDGDGDGHGLCYDSVTEDSDVDDVDLDDGGDSGDDGGDNHDGKKNFDRDLAPCGVLLLSAPEVQDLTSMG